DTEIAGCGGDAALDRHVAGGEGRNGGTALAGREGIATGDRDRAGLRSRGYRLGSEPAELPAGLAASRARVNGDVPRSRVRIDARAAYARGDDGARHDRDVALACPGHDAHAIGAGENDLVGADVDGAAAAHADSVTFLTLDGDGSGRDRNRTATAFDDDAALRVPVSVVPQPGESSGAGHENVSRLDRHLASAGHVDAACKITARLREASIDDARGIGGDQNGGAARREVAQRGNLGRFGPPYDDCSLARDFEGTGHDDSVRSGALRLDVPVGVDGHVATERKDSTGRSAGGRNGSGRGDTGRALRGGIDTERVRTGRCDVAGRHDPCLGPSARPDSDGSSTRGAYVTGALDAGGTGSAPLVADAEGKQAARIRALGRYIARADDGRAIRSRVAIDAERMERARTRSEGAIGIARRRDVAARDDAGIPADREDATREVARSGNVSIRLDGRCPVPCADTDADRTVAACDDIALAPYRHGGRALVEARLAAVRVVGEIAHREDS